MFFLTQHSSQTRIFENEMLSTNISYTTYGLESIKIKLTAETMKTKPIQKDDYIRVETSTDKWETVVVTEVMWLVGTTGSSYYVYGYGV